MTNMYTVSANVRFHEGADQVIRQESDFEDMLRKILLLSRIL